MCSCILGECTQDGLFCFCFHSKCKPIEDVMRISKGQKKVIWFTLWNVNPENTTWPLSAPFPLFFTSLNRQILERSLRPNATQNSCTCFMDGVAFGWQLSPRFSVEISPEQYVTDDWLLKSPRWTMACRYCRPQRPRFGRPPPPEISRKIKVAEALGPAGPLAAFLFSYLFPTQNVIFGEGQRTFMKINLVW